MAIFNLKAKTKKARALLPLRPDVDLSIEFDRRGVILTMGELGTLEMSDVGEMARFGRALSAAAVAIDEMNKTDG